MVHPRNDGLLIKPMQKSDGTLDHLDVRALRLLSLLLETRSVTRTAELMGISQPAASRALALLRDAACDPLLVRAGAGQALTERARTLLPLVTAALVSVRAVFMAAQFEPMTAHGVLRIATTDYGAVVMGGALAIALNEAAPRLDLELLPFGADTFERLTDGRLDFAFYADDALPAGIEHADLFAETYGVLLRRDHPLLAGVPGGHPLAPEILADWPQAVALYPDGRVTGEDDVLRRCGIATARNALRVTYFLGAPRVLAESDLVMCLPMRAARHLARDPSLLAHPLAAPLGFAYRALWHSRSRDDLRHQWVRHQLRSIGVNI